MSLTRPRSARASRKRDAILHDTAGEALLLQAVRWVRTETIFCLAGIFTPIPVDMLFLQVYNILTPDFSFFYIDLCIAFLWQVLSEKYLVKDEP